MPQKPKDVRRDRRRQAERLKARERRRELAAPKGEPPPPAS
jgi:hypothetical protein